MISKVNQKLILKLTYFILKIKIKKKKKVKKKKKKILHIKIYFTKFIGFFSDPESDRPSSLAQ